MALRRDRTRRRSFDSLKTDSGILSFLKVIQRGYKKVATFHVLGVTLHHVFTVGSTLRQHLYRLSNYMIATLRKLIRDMYTSIECMKHIGTSVKSLKVNFGFKKNNRFCM